MDHFGTPFPSSRSTWTLNTGFPARVPVVLVTLNPTAIIQPFPVVARQQTRWGKLISNGNSAH